MDSHKTQKVQTLHCRFARLNKEQVERNIQEEHCFAGSCLEQLVLCVREREQRLLDMRTSSGNLLHNESRRSL